MNDDSLKRFDRVVAILIQLQSKRIIKAQELADRFGISLRTVYRDIKMLEAAGVPLLSEAGVGYSIMDGYRLPPVMFTKEEAASFVAAEKLMEQFTDDTLGTFYKSAMFKIKSVLRGDEKDLIDAIASKVKVNTSVHLFNERIPNALETIFESIASKTQILLKYKSFYSDEVNERYLEPVGVFHDHNFWYLQAYCHLRKEYRQFRTDRMQAIEKTIKPFIENHPALETFLQKEETRERYKVVLSVKKPMAKYIKYDAAFYGLVNEEDKGDTVEMTFMTLELNRVFPRWFLMFADQATIIEPEVLKENVREILKNIQTTFK
ncbi:helix-turn-helix transcriptional regulator [Zhouia sp. PK063]|uniref:helix-turn-helix transcriptional regulator n=1 Tax=Zhouia sp. PK063 TaxID=3373602 RepID=UPI003795C880